MSSKQGASTALSSEGLDQTRTTSFNLDNLKKRSFFSGSKNASTDSASSDANKRLKFLNVGQYSGEAVIKNRLARDAKYIDIAVKK